MDIIVLILLVLVATFVVGGILSAEFARRLAPDRYEWLQVMNHTEWKRVPRLIEDLLKLKKAKYSFGLKGIIYTDLEFLENETLIETRKAPKEVYSLPITEYRLTVSGVGKRNMKIDDESETQPKNIRLN
jgi:hypothetical protein